ncbi:hypothetical protein RJ640_014278 [Escallonia rubra]|uniref:Uncharacterized protein n=1 Tax=Escallonia rubra TaxID=112253 RepID=A0AA88R8L8_9ASTE|nr:hypothetical protein RJ640_014278 [Escallonia rubra]
MGADHGSISTDMLQNQTVDFVAWMGINGRSKSNQYPSTSLIQIEGVNTKEEVGWYSGNRMAYIYNAKVKKNESHHRF